MYSPNAFPLPWSRKCSHAPGLKTWASLWGKGGEGSLFCLPPPGGGGVVAKSCPPLATPQTVPCQAPLSVEFSRQEYWSGLPFPSPGDLPDPEIKPRSPALQANSLPHSIRWEWLCLPFISVGAVNHGSSVIFPRSHNPNVTSPENCRVSAKKQKYSGEWPEKPFQREGCHLKVG